MSDSPISARTRRALTILAWWSVVVVAFSVYETFGYRWRGLPLTIGPRLARNAMSWSLWLLLTPLVAHLATRLPPRRISDWRRVFIHAAIATALTIVHSVVIAAVYPLLYYRPSAAAFRDVFQDRMVSAFLLNLFVYAAIVAATRASELRAKGAEAELRLLYEQLQPHFVFNTLTSVIELVHEGDARAEVVLRDLAALLRRSVECARVPDTTLAEELTFTERYIAIQRVRFPALQAVVEADPSLLSQRVPRLLLQPLVENAIRHSVGQRGTGRVEVSATNVGRRVRIVVRDDGDSPVRSSQSTGTGLANVRARLELFYAGRHHMELGRSADGTTRVTIDIPADVTRA